MFSTLNSIEVNLSLWWIPVLLISLGLLILRATRPKAEKDNVDIFAIIEKAGYAYDPEQDIFYSTMDPWQRNMGYCRLYDEALAPLGMIIDCEPIYFEYGGKSWLIELWKGQYALNSGCEIGVYTTEGSELSVPSRSSHTLYRCASNDDRLAMSFSLEKQGQLLFARADTHWWLTGFKLGEFSEPSELTLKIRITLKDEDMCNAFVEGLLNAGYSQDEIILAENTVKITFAETRTPQPVTRTTKTDRLIQRQNKLLCARYQEITGPYDTFLDKIKAIQEQAPDLFKKIGHLGKTENVFGSIPPGPPGV